MSKNLFLQFNFLHFRSNSTLHISLERIAFEVAQFYLDSIISCATLVTYIQRDQLAKIIFSISGHLQERKIAKLGSKICQIPTNP